VHADGGAEDLVGPAVLVGRCKNVTELPEESSFNTAISPFDRIGLVTEILLDLRAAPGMSGSPVVWPGSGQVIGIVTEMLEATVAMALPLDSSSLTQYLQAHDAARASFSRTPTLPSPSSSQPNPPTSPTDN
jgi:hypothetical protein